MPSPRNRKPDRSRPPDELTEIAERQVDAAFRDLRTVLHKKILFDSPRATLDRARRRLRAGDN